MNNEERQRQMDFLLRHQARHDHELAQIRRILLSAIRIGRRDRTDFREKLNALINAQIKSEEQVAAFRIESHENIAAIQAETREFQAETREFQAETRGFQAETRHAFSLLTKSVAETIDRVDAIEDSKENGGRPTN
jgi:ABC-type multidrug transport system fused ATPase/permease subunit